MALGATGSEDAWQRTAYISIENSSTVKLQYEALTETLDIDMAERELDKIDLLNLGQIPRNLELILRGLFGILKMKGIDGSFATLGCDDDKRSFPPLRFMRYTS